MKTIVSIDIGSTYTKGGLFGLSGGTLELLRLASRPTSAENLSLSFNEVLGMLSQNLTEEPPEICFSSSAKGGLRITAIGLVPSLTLESAKLSALSAGALVTGVYSYKLCEADIKKMRLEKPDIILLCGGSDGGNESYAIFNARLLAEAKLDATILYAGNRAAAKEVSNILEGCEFHKAGNVLPELQRPDPESAREKIRQIFLEKIVCGRGLDLIMRQCGADPLPTPSAMFDFLRGIYEARPDYGPFCAIDAGGATTDFYSCCPLELAVPGAQIKGLPEPKIKRSVEGDIGMRISAAAAVEAMREFITARLCSEELDEEAFHRYIERISVRPELLPSSSEEKIFEEILAEACCAGALKRHAGKCETAYLPEGKFLLQYGRNLRPVRKVICTGGYLSRMKGAAFSNCLAWASSDPSLLVPQEAELHVDERYLFPLLANVFTKYPEAAIQKGLESLKIA